MKKSFSEQKKLLKTKNLKKKDNKISLKATKKDQKAPHQNLDLLKELLMQRKRKKRRKKLQRKKKTEYQKHKQRKMQQ